jgi:hypothetical protein
MLRIPHGLDSRITDVVKVVNLICRYLRNSAESTLHLSVYLFKICFNNIPIHVPTSPNLCLPLSLSV